MRSYLFLLQQAPKSVNRKFVIIFENLNQNGSNKHFHLDWRGNCIIDRCHLRLQEIQICSSTGIGRCRNENLEKRLIEANPNNAPYQGSLSSSGAKRNSYKRNRFCRGAKKTRMAVSNQNIFNGKRKTYMCKFSKRFKWN